MLINSNQELIKKITRFFDSLVSSLAFYLAVYIKNNLVPVQYHSTISREELLITLILIPIGFYICASLLDVYHARYIRFLDVLIGTFKNMICLIFVMLVFFFIFRINTLGRLIISIYFLLSMIFVVTSRYMALTLFRHYIQRGLYCRNILIVGTGYKTKEFISGIEQNEFWGLNIVGVIELDEGDMSAAPSSYPVLGTIKEFKSILHNQPIDDVICTVPLNKLAHLQYILETSEEVGVTVKIISNFFNLVVAKSRMDNLDGLPILTYSTTPSNLSLLYLKRLFDFIFSLINLVLFAPVLIVTSILIRLSSPGPVFFVQDRCGLNGRRFKMLKFRTMVENAESLKQDLENLNELDGPVFKIKKDPRITWVGRILRKTSLDEIPQFINVLKGEMSIVGPRPPIPEEVEQYQPWQRRRLSMRPGLTCLWQVSGRDNISFDTWMKLDLKYIDNWSFLTDLKIIVRTIPVVLFGKGSY
jgi:exopolysaccharide biosynthesis polyprenyl glycosylphosphotransferase